MNIAWKHRLTALKSMLFVAAMALSGVLPAQTITDEGIRLRLKTASVVVIGQVEKVEATGMGWAMGATMYIARIRVRSAVRGRVRSEVYVLFAPGLGDEASIDTNKNYVLFLAPNDLSLPASVRTPGREFFRVAPPEGGVFLVAGDRLAEYSESACSFANRVAALSGNPSFDVSRCRRAMQ